MHDPELWSRLRAFPFDDPAAVLPFSARLARDNGWSRAYARRVVEEYRRFLYLACAAGHPVTPSDEVDQAWHLHLAYSRSYWDELCGTVLARPLHHGPTRGGATEDAKFGNWYARTLASYRAQFGAEPPADVWPPAAVRFGAQRFQRIDRARHWVLPRRPVRLALSAATAGLLAAGCGSALAAQPAAQVLVLVLVVVAVVVGLVLAARPREPREERRHSDGGGCGVHGGSSGCGHRRDEASGCGADSGGGSDSGCGGGGCGGGGCGGD